MIKFAVFCLIINDVLNSNAMVYDDRRCSCVCPGLGKVADVKLWKTFYRDNVPAYKCNCDGMVLPRVGHRIIGSPLAFCMECDCKYETRNTTMIMVVLICLCWILCLLLLYIICFYLLNTVTMHQVYHAQITEPGLQEDTVVLLGSDDGPGPESGGSELDYEVE